MMRRFRLAGQTASFDPAAAIAASRTLARLRARMVRIHGRRAGDLIEDMVLISMRRIGNHHMSVRGAQIDRIMNLRVEVDDLYRRLMRGDVGPNDVDVEMARLTRRYEELDDAFGDLAEEVDLAPVRREIEELGERLEADLQDPTGQRIRNYVEHDHQAAGRTLDQDLGTDMRASAGTRAHRHGWRHDDANPGTFVHIDNGDVNAGVRSRRLSVVQDPSGREVYQLDLELADGTPMTIREGAINLDRYSQRLPTTRLFNAHHGVQSAPMRRIFGSLYDPADAPTIRLRNATTGSPHGRITAIEGRRTSDRTNPGSKFVDSDFDAPDSGGVPVANYGELRNRAIGEMRSVGVSEDSIRAYLAAHDAFVRDRILPNIPSADHRRILGDWSPLSDIGGMD